MYRRKGGVESGEETGDDRTDIMEHAREPLAIKAKMHIFIFHSYFTWITCFTPFISDCHSVAFTLFTAHRPSGTTTPLVPPKIISTHVRHFLQQICTLKQQPPPPHFSSASSPQLSQSTTILLLSLSVPKNYSIQAVSSIRFGALLQSVRDAPHPPIDLPSRGRPWHHAAGHKAVSPGL